MATSVSLAQLRLQAPDDVSRNVISLVERSSWLASHTPIKQCAAYTGGSALAAVYTRENLEATATWRELDHDYVDQVSTVELVTTVLKIFGASFGLDDVIKDAGGGVALATQLDSHVRAVAAGLNDAFINGNSSTSALQFDGIGKIVNGTANDIDASAVDLTVMTAANAYAFLEAIEDANSRVYGSGTRAYLVNRATKVRLGTMARLAGSYTHSEDAFGNQIDFIGGIPIIDVGYAAGSASDPAIAVAGGGVDDTTTDIYVVNLDVATGVHLLAPASGPFIKTVMPQVNGSSTQRGRVELVGAVGAAHVGAIARLKTVKLATGTG